jgi:hypothetical protein
MNTKFNQNSLPISQCTPADGGSGTRRTPADGGSGTRRAPADGGSGTRQ